LTTHATSSYIKLDRIYALVRGIPRSRQFCGYFRDFEAIYCSARMSDGESPTRFQIFFIPMESTHDDMMDAYNAIALKKLLKRTIVLDNFYLSSLEIRSHYLMVDFCPRCNQFLKLRQLRFQKFVLYVLHSSSSFFEVSKIGHLIID